jgi:hypothetical protein
MTQPDRNVQFSPCSAELRIGQNCSNLESFGIALARRVADGRRLESRLAPSNRCFGSRRDAVSTATTLFSLAGRNEKEAKEGTDDEIGRVTRAIKEKYANYRHASSQSTRKAMRQSHILKMRRSVTRFAVIRENGKGGSPVGLVRTVTATFKDISARAGVHQPRIREVVRHQS